MKVNICGVLHDVVESEDILDFGSIEYRKGRIVLQKNLTKDIKEEALCHEMVHGMLIHMGYTEFSEDERFVQALGNAIYQGFSPRRIKNDNA